MREENVVEATADDAGQEFFNAVADAFHGPMIEALDVVHAKFPDEPVLETLLYVMAGFMLECEYAPSVVLQATLDAVADADTEHCHECGTKLTDEDKTDILARASAPDAQASPTIN